MTYIFYFIYSFLIIRFCVTLFNFISNPKLSHSRKSYQSLVSILIPARNEAHTIIHLLHSIKNQNYNNIEVIVLDDDSSDNTYEIVNQFCMSDERFSIIKGVPLPNHWLGKNYACHQLAKKANGDYFLFLDADEEVKDDLINNALHRMAIGKLSLLSLFANQKMITLGEKLCVPIMHYLLLNLLPLRLVKLSSNPAFSAASGQCMLFEAKKYHQYQWHKMVKSKVVEDIEIMKLVKLYQLKAETLLANRFLYCRMYSGYSDGLQGFSKNLLAGFNNNIIGLIIFNIIIGIGFPLIVYFLNLPLIVFALGLIVLSRLMISFISNQNIIENIILHFPQIFTLLLITILTLYKSATHQHYWKGRKLN